MAILTFLTTVLNLLIKHPYKLIIVVLVIIIILQRACSPSAETINTHSTDTVTHIVRRVDTVQLIDTCYIPKISYRVKIDTIIDTVFILQEYFTKNYYTDTILNSSKGFVSIDDIVYQNKIISRTPTIKLYPETIIETRTVSVITPPRVKVFVGFGINATAGFNPGLNANFALLTKKDHLYSIGFDVINKRVDLGIYWKLKFRR